MFKLYSAYKKRTTKKEKRHVYLFKFLEGIFQTTFFEQEQQISCGRVIIQLAGSCYLKETQLVQKKLLFLVLRCAHGRICASFIYSPLLILRAFSFPFAHPLSNKKQWLTMSSSCTILSVPSNTEAVHLSLFHIKHNYSSHLEAYIINLLSILIFFKK